MLRPTLGPGAASQIVILEIGQGLILPSNLLLINSGGTIISNGTPAFAFERLNYRVDKAASNLRSRHSQTLALLFTAIVIMSNFLADVAHQLVDPRVRDRARAA